MASELQAYTTSGLTLYAVLISSTGQIWNGAAFEAYNGANWTSYDITLTEAGAGIYLGNMPAAAAGMYSYIAYEQAGVNPATTDTIRGNGSLAWNGTAEVKLSDLALQATVLAITSGATAAQVWAYATRTLTQTAAQIAAAVNGSSITIMRGDTLSASLTGIGAITGYTTLDFMVKKQKSDLDTSAIIHIRKNASAVNDGLIRINGVAGTAGNGSITLNDQALGNITIALIASETAKLIPGLGYYYDIQKITGVTVTTMSEGTFNVTPDVTMLVVP